MTFNHYWSCLDRNGFIWHLPVKPGSHPAPPLVGLAPDLRLILAILLFRQHWNSDTGLLSHLTKISPLESWLRQSLSSDEKPLSRSKCYTLPKQQVVLRAGEQMMPGSRDLHLRVAYLISNKIQTLILSLVRCELWSKVLVKSIYFLCDSLETNAVEPTFLPLSPWGH